MNYEQAHKLLHHATTGKFLGQRQLCNATTLLGFTGNSGAWRDIELHLFSKHILTWFPDGSIKLDNKGWWKRTTIERYNKYLPQGFRVQQWRPYWYLDTPTGTRLWNNGATFTREGYNVAHDAPHLRRLRELSFLGLRNQVRVFADMYTELLVDGAMSAMVGQDKHFCTYCFSERTLERVLPEHLLSHVQELVPPTNLIESALKHAGPRPDKNFLRELLGACWTESQVMTRKVRTKKAAIAQAEALMTHEGPRPNTDIKPRHHRKLLRELLEEFLLTGLGFEKMAE